MQEDPLGKRLKDGDRDVLRTILEEHGTSIIRRLHRSFSLKCEDVDDLLSLSLMRMWLKRDGYDPNRASIASWWWVIVKHLCIDHLRAKQRGGVMVHLTNAIAEDERTRNPGSESESERLRGIKRILEEFSESDRRILLSYAEAETMDQGHGRIAWASQLSRELGVPAKVLRTRRIRLTQRLKKRLEECEQAS